MILPNSTSYKELCFLTKSHLLQICVIVGREKTLSTSKADLLSLVIDCLKRRGCEVGYAVEKIAFQDVNHIPSADPDLNQKLLKG